jgi:hypothetical protein
MVIEAVIITTFLPAMCMLALQAWVWPRMVAERHMTKGIESPATITMAYGMG